MWFKNIQIFQLVEPFTLTPDQLQELMQEHVSRPCSKLERMHYGWTSPLGLDSELLVHVANGRYMIAARKEEKILPTTVVREQAAIKAAEIERNENRKVTGREKRALIDQVTMNLLPQAFSKSQTTFAYIDTFKNWLVVDSSNRSRAEDLTVLLRSTLGSLKLAEITVKTAPAAIFTRWVLGEDLPRDFILEDNCELQDPNAASTVIKCVNQDVTAKEVIGHIDSGKQVIKLAMTWQDRMTFLLDNSLNVRRIRFLDLVQQQVDDSQLESAAEKFDADFVIFTAEFAEFLPRLWEVMGGVENTEMAEEKKVAEVA
jgi:recombination associated protein RdgC